MASRRNRIRLVGLIVAAVIAIVTVRMITPAFSPRAKAERILGQVARCNGPPGMVGKLLRKTSREFRQYRHEHSVNFLIGHPGKIEVIEKLLALGPEARPALIEAINDPDRSVRICAMRALAEGRDPRAFEILIAALGDKDDQTSVHAILCLGRLRDRRAFEPLVERLGGPEGYFAARALGKLGDQRAVEPLIDAIAKRPAGAFAVYALNELKPRRAVGPLTDALASSLQGTDKFRTASLLEELAKPSFPLEDPRLPALLAQAATSDNRDTRSKAAKVLGRVDDPRAIETLRSLLQDPDLRVRKAAAKGLARAKSLRGRAQEQPRQAG